MKDSRFSVLGLNQEDKNKFVSDKQGVKNSTEFQSHKSNEPGLALQGESAEGGEDAKYTASELDEHVRRAVIEAREEDAKALEVDLSKRISDAEARLSEEFSCFVEDARRHILSKEPFLEPVRLLAMSLAEEIALHALSSTAFKYNELIENVLENTDLTSLDEIEVVVSKNRAEKIKNGLAGMLSGVKVLTDEKLQDGDVLLRSDTTQVQSLIADRVADLKLQLENLQFDDPLESEATRAVNETESVLPSETSSIGRVESTNHDYVPHQDGIALPEQSSDLNHEK